MEGYRFCARGPDAVDGFEELEVVVWGEEGDCFVNLLIVQYIIGYRVQGARGSTGCRA